MNNDETVEQTHSTLLATAEAWGRLAERADCFTREIAEHLHASGRDPYQLTLAELLPYLAQVEAKLRQGVPAGVPGCEAEARR